MSHIVLISGSHRQNSQSRKVTNFAAATLKQLDGQITTDIIDLAGNPLPLWDGKQNDVWKDFSARLIKADGFVIVSPEWHGMVPAGLKNFFLHTNAKEMGHKPATILSVSAGHGGTHPINELRISSYKNNRLVYTPDHVIVQHCNNVLNGETEADATDGYIRRRIAYALRALLAYVQAFKPIRLAGLDNPEFPNGM